MVNYATGRTATSVTAGRDNVGENEEENVIIIRKSCKLSQKMIVSMV